MQDTVGCKTTEYKSTGSPLPTSPISINCNVLRENLSGDSLNIPCATLKRWGSDTRYTRYRMAKTFFRVKMLIRRGAFITFLTTVKRKLYPVLESPGRSLVSIWIQTKREFLADYRFSFLLSVFFPIFNSSFFLPQVGLAAAAKSCPLTVLAPAVSATRLPTPATRLPPPATRLPPPATSLPPPATRLPPPATRLPPPVTHRPGIPWPRSSVRRAA
jgi:hypothetical protein